MRKVFLALLLLAAPAGAVIRFNDGAAMTTAASFTGSRRPPGGGVILHVSGTFDGASVALEVNGGAAWIAADTCAAMTAAQICRAAVGPVDLRVTITSAGAGTSVQVVGFEAQVVVALSGLTAVGSAASIDADSDAVDEISVAASAIALDPDDDGVAEEVLNATSLTFGAAAMTSTTGVGLDASSGNLRLTNSGPTGWRVQLNSNRIEGRIADGFSIFADGSSSTAPTYGFLGDSDTGIRRDSGGGVLIQDETQGVLTLSWDGTDARSTGSVFRLTPRSAAPTTPGTGDVYYDTDNGAPCVYTGAGFVQVNDLTTGCT